MLAAIEARIAGWLGGHGGPTTDLYFANACAGGLAAGRIERLSATVFRAGDVVVVVRHGGGLDVTRLGGRLVWICDDAVEAGVRERALPWDHRLKLRLVDLAAARRLARRAEVVVVSTERLVAMARGLGARRVEVAHPFWSEAPLSLDHHDAPPVRRDPGAAVEVAYLGAGTHGADLALVLPALRALLARPGVRVSVPATHRLPEDLSGHARVRRITETAWPAYRAAFGARRWHMVLYPLAETAFNRGRSVNKLIEHGLLGAAGIYSEGWAEAGRIAEAGAGVLVPNAPAAWAEAAVALAADRARMRDLAAAGQALALALNGAARQQALWTDLLGEGVP